MSDRAGFLTAILAEPTDDTARLVYADWLREQPGAFDQRHGRFMWAGLTLARFRGQEVVEDGMFFDAIRDQNDTAPDVLAAQLRRLLGWDRLTTEWAWDNDTDAPDRIHVVALPPKTEGESRAARQERRRNPVPPPTVTYERGCLAALRVTAAQWQASAPEILRSCPLERVELLEVPGLTLRIVNWDGWRIQGEFRPPHLRRRQNRDGTTVLAVDVVACHPQHPQDVLTREQFVARVVDATWAVLTRLHFLAGFSWTGPLPDTLIGPGPYVGVDPSAELLGET